MTLNFLIPRLQPGDPAEAIVSRLTGKSEAVDPAQVEAIRKLLGAPDGNLFTQYLDYLGALFHGDFGISYTYFPYTVTDMIGTPLPWTIVLVGVTRSCRSSSAPCSARGRRTGATPRIDSVITLGSTFIGTLPFFWIALLLIYVFAITLQWFPDGGGYGGGSSPGWNWLFFSDAIQHSVLPAMALMITGPIGWIIGMRNNMVQSSVEDYARLARAEGPAAAPDRADVRRPDRDPAERHRVRDRARQHPRRHRPRRDDLQLPRAWAGCSRGGGQPDFPLMQALFLFTTVGVLIANFLADMRLRLPGSAGPQDGGGMTIQGSIPAPDGTGAGDTERVERRGLRGRAGRAGCPAGSSSCGATASAGSAW